MSKFVNVLSTCLKLRFGTRCVDKKKAGSVIDLASLPFSNRTFLLELVLVFVGPFHLLSMCTYLVL